MKEKAFQNKVKKEITDRGGWCVKFFANAFSQAGTPDILACYKGQFLGIETKGETEGYGATALQQYNIEKIKEAGGEAFILCPEQWDDFLKVLDEMERKKYEKTEV